MSTRSMRVSVWLYFLFVVSCVTTHEINEEMQKRLRKVCEEANEEIQKTGMLQQPQIIELARPIPSPTWKHSTAIYFSLPYFLFDPLNQFPTYFNNGQQQLVCPLCLRAGQNQLLLDSAQWKTGKCERLKPRLIHDVAGPVLLVSKLYRCGKGHREIVACDPDIVKQLPETFVSFVTSHRSGVTKHLLNLCEQLLDKGLSLNSIEDLNRERYDALYDAMMSRFLTDLDNCRSLGHSCTDVNVPNFNELNWSLAGACLLTGAITSHFQRNEDIYRKLFSSLSAEWISCDHTYKSVTNIGYHRSSDGKWIKRYNGFFIVGNEKGQPIQWKFTKTEQFDEVSGTFSQLAERFKQQKKQIKGIFTDTCCKWASKFEDIFPGVPIKLDIFHAVQRFTSSIPKRKQYHAQIARDYSLVFRDPLDLGERRMAFTPEKRVLLKNMEKFEAKWKNVKYNNGQNVLNVDAEKAIKNIKVHINKGCLSAIPPGCGTNRNERLNRHLNEFLSNNKISLLLAHARCFRLFSKLKSMRKETKEMFTPRHSNDGAERSDSTGSVKLESFGGDDRDVMEEDHEKKGWNVNEVKESTVKEIASKIQNLLENQGRKLSLTSENVQNTFEHDYGMVSYSRDKSNSLVLLHNAVCLWRSYIQLSDTFGKKVVDYELMGVNAKKQTVSSTVYEEPANSVPGTNPDEAQSHHTANAWGFQIVDMPGDGNCFFTAVAFHLHQLVTNCHSESDIVRNHLEALGIHSELTIPGLANILRRLIVDEWTGPNMPEYQNYLIDDNIAKAAEEFLNNGHFSTSLGDAMPLAMANVLQIPILILVPHHLIPFLSVFPRYNVECIPPILLAYNNTGPGHYDALVKSTREDGDHDNCETVQVKETHAENGEFRKNIPAVVVLI